ncbi:MAG: ABC transporter substrate-binding protein [Pseudomonadota bacterium]
MVRIRPLRLILSAFALTFLAPIAQADERCEEFIGGTLEDMFASINRDPARDDPELHKLMRANVDTQSIAKFTLGKYAARVTADDLHVFAGSLNTYLLETIYDNIQGGEKLSADILKSFDRNHRDCIVQTVIHRESLEDVLVIWRVMRVGDHHQVIDLAIEQNGNTIWLALELRAQVVALYERSGGDLDVVIHELGMG